MKPEKKAIQTLYHGYRFRSRLEARWAVFFDALGIKWEYEPEGFNLHGNIYYLPDFYVPSLDMYFEVKASELTGEEERKCELLRDETDKPVVALIGTPGQFFIENEDRDAKIFCWDMTDGSAGCSYFDCVLYAHEAFGIIFAVHDQFSSRKFCRGCMFQAENRIVQFAGRWDNAMSIEKTIEAATRARSARFEHGERP